MKTQSLISICFFSGLFIPAFAQHQHNMKDSSMHNMNNMQMKDTTPNNMNHDMNNIQMNDSMHTNMKNMKMPARSPDGNDSDMSMMNMDMGAAFMSSSLSLNLPMNRDGSGTAWLPDSTPMYAVMMQSKKWMYMLHGSIFLRYTKQDIGDKGSRGDKAFDAPNWIMFMVQRKVGKNGLFHFRSMISFDPFTVGGSGYPLLFQTGESRKGQPLIDHQHPHDLFSELSVSYSQALSKKTDVFVYLGYPGEPAIGSVAFMHRPSALPYPDAPITHHWNDGTHITFGVATIGVRLNKFKLEASSFTGREPNENRYNFDKPTFDSWAGRLSFNPSQNWSLQVSHAYVKSPEELHPEENVYRTTASAIVSYPLGKEKSFDATALWGLNKIKEQNGDNAALAEASLRIKRAIFYSRYEWVQKTGEELDLNPAEFKMDAQYPINVISVGATYDLLHANPINIALGGQFSFYHADSKLDVLYGKNPVLAEIFLRIYPSLMKMHNMHGMSSMGGM